jgi:hypothetical protein
MTGTRETVRIPQRATPVSKYLPAMDISGNNIRHRIVFTGPPTPAFTEEMKILKTMKETDKTF